MDPLGEKRKQIAVFTEHTELLSFLMESCVWKMKWDRRQSHGLLRIE